MSYNAENYRRVKREIDDARQAAVSEAEARTAALHRESREIREIDENLSLTGRRIFKEACRGGADLAQRIESLKNENQSLISKRNECLKAMGLPADYTDIHYRCSKCMDTGFVETQMCDCMRAALIKEGFRSSGVGVLIDRQNFDNFSLDYYAEDKDTFALMRYAYDECRRYAEEFTPGYGNLLFMGGTGLGKTHLSTSIARRVIERGYDVRYESAQNIFADFEYDRFRAKGDDIPRGDKYMTAELLIIDDLGTEMQTQFTVSCLYNLLNTRLNRGKSTIISTNLSDTGIEQRYDDRITSRLLGEYKVVLFRGQDVRKQKL